MRFCVLASGSSGNASVLSAGGFGVLLDLGLGPRTLTRRLADVGASWNDVHAAVLTHVHGDHWNENTLAHLARRDIPLHCHQSHATALKYESPVFAELLESDRLFFYEVGATISLGDQIACRPLVLRHDGGMTCGFRFEGALDGLGKTWALAYAADLGSWDADLAEALANVDILALEFNHDEQLEKQSGRGQALIQRVLGDHGHLSNRQAAELLAAVLARSDSGRLQHVVQLHLSRQCNRPELARMEAAKIVEEHWVELHTGAQDSAGAWLGVRAAPTRKKARSSRRMACPVHQPWLPGWET
jgi:phosphoribosyl 1,2-cyclic phosphodiesterase